jgi:predicted nucleotidyltransferase
MWYPERRISSVRHARSARRRPDPETLPRGARLHLRRAHERVVLFGSRARGDANAASDYDVAIFLKDFEDRWREIDRIIPVVTDILYENEALIHAMPYRAGAYQDHTSLLREIRREGIDL